MSASAALYGCAGLTLDEREAAFFREADPWGFIVFKRNVGDAEQLRALTGALRETVGRDAPILVDQEGGRVQRLGPPHWPARPPAARIGAVAERDPAAAAEAAGLIARLIGTELRAVGLTVDCLPLLDVPQSDADPIIGDRAYGQDPALVSRLGAACLAGLAEAGVGGVIKHTPGHGRADVDSHLALPRVAAPREALEAVDFPPFAALKHAPAAMTAHVVYEAIDPDAPATTSAAVIAQIIRGHIGFDGLLMSDDLSMQALSGDLRTRAEAALSAGCDVVLHCNGDMAEMEAIAAAVPRLSGRAAERADGAAPPQPAGEIDVAADEARLAALLALAPAVPTA